MRGEVGIQVRPVSVQRMVRVQPVADDPAPNDLIDMAPFQVHAKNRIKYPMVRKSWVEL